MASSNSPCAACKFLRRKCTQECVFAPYFPPDQPEKFANVHKVFGASNVAKLLNDLPSVQREDAVNSLAYEARMRLHDPVYGCVGIISVLQQRLKVVQHELYNARKELASYVGPSAMHPLVVPNANHHPQAQMLHPHHLLQNNASSSMGGAVFGGGPMVGLEMPPGASAQQQQAARIQQQQMLEAQQMAALREQQELMRSYEQQQQELVRYNSNSPFVGEGNHNGSSAGFNHMSGGMPSNLALVPVDNQFPIQQQQHQQPELLQHHHHQEEERQHQQQSVIKHDGNGNEGGGGGTSVVGPSS